MKKYIILWVLVLCCLFGCCAEASTGQVDILVNEKEEFVFTYTKVADYKNGEFVLHDIYLDSGVDLNQMNKGSDLRKAAEIISAYAVDKIQVETENQIAHIDSLSEGVYLLEGMEEEEYEIPAALVMIPNWDETDEELSYHVTIVPKIERIVEPVETGDTTKTIPIILLCIFSLSVIMGVFGRSCFLKDK